MDPFTKPAPAQDADGTAQREPRTYAQRLADALVELARRALAAGQLPVHGGKRPQVMVTFDHQDLAAKVGLGTLDTGTPVSPETARRIGCDADIIPAVLDADGIPLDVGRSRRLFDDQLRDALILRDRGCAH